MNILSVILARGGSKGIPRKNLVNLGGTPLIGHIIQKVLSISIKTDVVLSTEDDEIAEVALEYGAEVPFTRPPELAEDHVRSLPVVQHAVRETEKIKGYTYDFIIYLQPTAPLCRADDIESCIEKLIQRKDANSVVTIAKVDKHPFKMKRLINGERIINYIDQGFEDMRPRQELPDVYRRSGAVYASRREVIMEESTLVGDPCLGVVVPPETAIDIDTPLDLELARIVLNRKNRNKES